MSGPEPYDWRLVVRACIDDHDAALVKAGIVFPNVRPRDAAPLPHALRLLCHDAGVAA